MDELDQEEIYRWIDSFEITRQKKNIHRDFSDAVPLAEILKQTFPKMVDLHNYSSKNAFAQKLNNWMTLQRKVLSKLKINLTKPRMEELARAEPGVIEQVLFSIKAVVEDFKYKEQQKAEAEVYLVEGMDGDLDPGIVPIKVKRGDTLSDQKIVPSDVFDEMVKTLSEKEEFIDILKAKVDHLEKLLKIKDERIDDLTVQLDKVSSEVEKNPSTHLIDEMF